MGRLRVLWRWKPLSAAVCRLLDPTRPDPLFSIPMGLVERVSIQQFHNISRGRLWRPLKELAPAEASPMCFRPLVGIHWHRRMTPDERNRELCASTLDCPQNHFPKELLFRVSCSCDGVVKMLFLSFPAPTVACNSRPQFCPQRIRGEFLLGCFFVFS
ncbi:hypothetical protein QBC38DRAFT_484105 [Podospora fimiseda]|uniref:Uncharacterized protein n=1 Tax=Podospora fimiseda TaxID=252190 RepID=A0AAN7BKM8_9PEZI|nr:hypothetical protein QBC38DRAFT_484105 [Podospora fimiseda]